MSNDNAKRHDLREVKALLKLFDDYGLETLEVDGIKIQRSPRPAPLAQPVIAAPTNTAKPKKPINLDVSSELEAFFSPQEGYGLNGSN